VGGFSIWDQWICFLFDLERFGNSGFQFRTISLQYICFHSIRSDLAADDSLWNDIVSVDLLSTDLERFGHSGTISLTVTLLSIRFGAIRLGFIFQEEMQRAPEVRPFP